MKSDLLNVRSLEVATLVVELRESPISVLYATLSLCLRQAFSIIVKCPRVAPAELLLKHDRVPIVRYSTNIPS